MPDIRDSDHRRDFLKRFRAIPSKCGTQDSVAGNDPVPGGVHFRNVDRLVKGHYELLDIHATAWFGQGMVEHALLQRRQRVTLG